jgi:UDPglucose 6-dehydrogenase
LKISVIGTGYVGLVTATCFADLGHHVIGVDDDKSKIRVLKSGKSHFYEPGLEEMLRKNMKARRLRFTSNTLDAVRASDVVFISVGTPPKEYGEADLSQIEDVAQKVAKGLSKRYKIIIEKSTVPVQTGERIRHTLMSNARRGAQFDVVSNPEFLREGSSIHDFFYPDRVVLGTSSKKAQGILKELYRDIKSRIVFTDVNSAEIIKHASNAFLAMKISYVNALSHLCEVAHADIEEVADGVGMDKRIGRQFLDAGIGFGGFCFPKDLAAFIRISEKLGYDFKLLKEVLEINQMQWRSFVKKVEDHLWNLGGKTIGVWGLSFKPNTDDMRGAPSIPIIKQLLSEGAKVVAFDPQAMNKAKPLLPQIKYARGLYDVCKKSDCLLILTEWSDFKDAELSRVKQLLRQPLIIDGRNLFDPLKMKKLGFRYVSIGRRPV